MPLAQVYPACPPHLCCFSSELVLSKRVCFHIVSPLAGQAIEGFTELGITSTFPKHIEVLKSSELDSHDGRSANVDPDSHRRLQRELRLSFALRAVWRTVCDASSVAKWFDLALLLQYSIIIDQGISGYWFHPQVTLTFIIIEG